MEVRIGEITHYYNRIGVAVLKLGDRIQVGDMINIVGYTTEFTQRVESLEINHQKVESAGPGDDVALKVWDYVRDGDEVFKIVDSGYEK
jgi:translation elongation factor EF-1alpha